ncbi:MAG: type I methionyl aminopeptidase [Flavobacteriales bacterium]
MVYSKEEIELIKESSLLVGKTLAEVGAMIKPGITTLDLDQCAEEFICDHQSKPAFKGYNGFPNTLCTSRNLEVVHGIPNDRALHDGDIVSIDCGVVKNGFYGDSAFTFEVGQVDDQICNLLRATRESLNLGVQMAVAGNRVGDIGHAIQQYAESMGYSVVRELVGHGVGRNLHESPEVPNFGKRGRGPVLKEGTVIAIEPMINLGRKQVRQLKDGWTVVTADGKPSAHFEHTVAVCKGRAEVLSTFEFIDNKYMVN